MQSLSCPISVSLTHMGQMMSCEAHIVCSGFKLFGNVLFVFVSAHLMHKLIYKCAKIPVSNFPILYINPLRLGCALSLLRLLLHQYKYCSRHFQTLWAENGAAEQLISEQWWMTQGRRQWHFPPACPWLCHTLLVGWLSFVSACDVDSVLACCLCRKRRKMRWSVVDWKCFSGRRWHGLCCLLFFHFLYFLIQKTSSTTPSLLQAASRAWSGKTVCSLGHVLISWRQWSFLLGFCDECLTPGS